MRVDQRRQHGVGAKIHQRRVIAERQRRPGTACRGDATPVDGDPPVEHRAIGDREQPAGADDDHRNDDCRLTIDDYEGVGTHPCARTSNRHSPFVHRHSTLASRLFGGARACRVIDQFGGDRGVAFSAGLGQAEHARDVALAEDRIAKHVVVHVAALGGEAGVLDVTDDLEFVHAVRRAGGPDDVFLDHDRAHVVGAEQQAQLPHLAALRHPRGLQVVEVVEDEPCDGERAQIVHSRRFERDAVLQGKLGVIGLKAPGDERGEAAGLVLQLAQAQQVLQAFFERFDGAIHHRGGRAKARMVRLAHHTQPLVCRRLSVAVQQLPHAVDEDLGASTGNAVEAGGDEPRDDRRHRQLRHARDVQHLGRRQRVQLEVRIPCLHGTKQVLVPRDAADRGCARLAAAVDRRPR